MSEFKREGDKLYILNHVNIRSILINSMVYTNIENLIKYLDSWIEHNSHNGDKSFFELLSKLKKEFNGNEDISLSDKEDILSISIKIYKDGEYDNYENEE
jgi:hypothetical protein